MKHFSEDQLKELESMYGLVRIKKETEEEGIQILDAIVTKGNTVVWWQGVDGPETTTTKADWRNMKEFPYLDAIHKPRWNAEAMLYTPSLEED